MWRYHFRILIFLHPQILLLPHISYIDSSFQSKFFPFRSHLSFADCRSIVDGGNLRARYRPSALYRVAVSPATGARRAPAGLWQHQARNRLDRRAHNPPDNNFWADFEHDFSVGSASGGGAARA